MSMSKGTMSDLMFLFFIVFFVGMLLLIGGSTQEIISTAFQDNEQVQELSSAEHNITAMVSRGSDFYTGYSNFFPILVIGFGVILFFLAKQSSNDPLFLGISFLLLIIIIVIGMPLANGYSEFAESDFAAEKASEYTLTDLIFSNFVILIIIYAIIIVIGLYSGSQQGGTGGF